MEADEHLRHVHSIVVVAMAPQTKPGQKTNELRAVVSDRSLYSFILLFPTLLSTISYATNAKRMVRRGGGGGGFGDEEGGRK